MRRLYRVYVIRLSKRGTHLMRAQKAATLIVSLGIFSGLGCGSDGVCDKADQASRNLANAAAGCGSGDGGVSTISISGSTYSKAACQNALTMCSAADQQALSSVFDCFAKVNRCVPGQENQFLGSAFACVLTAGNISQACSTAFSH